MSINFPTIDLSKTYNVWYNGQSVNITTKDGYVWTEVKALRQPITTDSVDLGKGQKMGQRTKCTWLLFKNLIPTGLMPQIGDRIEDVNGDYWLVNKIVNRYFGNITTLETESLAGLGVTDVQIPVGSTSTTPAPSPSSECLLTIDSSGDTLAWSAYNEGDIAWTMCETCYSNGSEQSGLTISSQQRGCVTRLGTGWHYDSLILEKQQTSGVKIEVTSAVSTLNITCNATYLTNGTILLLKNNSVYNVNFAGESINISDTTIVGDVWQIYIMSNMNLAEGAISAEFTVS